MGIPTAAVVNFDILRNEDLIGLLERALVPKAIIEHVRTLALPIVEAFVRNGAAVKEHGIGALEGTEAEAAWELVGVLGGHGIFVVPWGEVESWLSGLGVGAQKGRWLESIFERMKTDPAEPGFTQPAANDVWRFVRDISKWLAGRRSREVRAVSTTLRQPDAAFRVATARG